MTSGTLFRWFDADRGLGTASRRGARRVATAWVRGLGDVAFIVNEFVRHVHGRLPGAEVSLLVRPGLEDAGRWIEGVHRVVPVAEWSRERTLTSPWGLAFPPPWEIARALARRGLGGEIDAIVPYPLGRWYERDPGRRRPRLRWTEAERRFGPGFIERAFPARPRFVVSLHTRVGTGRFYDYNKEWGTANFGRLARMILDAIPESGLVVVDAERVAGLPEDPRIADASGALTAAQSVAAAAASDLFIGLDAGLANLVYFLEGLSLDVLVLLGRTSIFTPLRYPPASPDVRLVTIVGEGEEVGAIAPEAVLAAVRAVHARRARAPA